MPQLCDDLSVIALAAGFFRCEPSWELAPRTKSGHQLWLTTGGRAVLCDDHGARFSLQERTALLIPPGTRHWGSHDAARPLHCYVVHFQTRRYGIPMPGALLSAPAMTRLDMDDWSHALTSAEEACREIPSARPGSALLANAAASRLLGLFLRHCTVEESQLPGVRSAAVQRVLDRITGQHRREWTLAELARIAGLSPAHLCRVFGREIGLTPFQYLRHHRLNVALQLLSETDLPIGDVASRAGFEDRFYFSRAFRRAHGLAPSVYRRARRESSLS